MLMCNKIMPLKLCYMLTWFLLGDKGMEFPVDHGIMCSLSATALVRPTLK